MEHPALEIQSCFAGELTEEVQRAILVAKGIIIVSGSAALALIARRLSTALRGLLLTWFAAASTASQRLQARIKQTIPWLQEQGTQDLKHLDFQPGSGGKGNTGLLDALFNRAPEVASSTTASKSGATQSGANEQPRGQWQGEVDASSAAAAPLPPPPPPPPPTLELRSSNGAIGSLPQQGKARVRQQDPAASLAQMPTAPQLPSRNGNGAGGVRKAVRNRQADSQFVAAQGHEGVLWRRSDTDASMPRRKPRWADSTTGGSGAANQLSEAHSEQGRSVTRLQSDSLLVRDEGADVSHMKDSLQRRVAETSTRAQHNHHDAMRRSAAHAVGASHEAEQGRVQFNTDNVADAGIASGVHSVQSWQDGASLQPGRRGDPWFESKKPALRQ